MSAHIRHTLGKAPARPQLAGRLPVKLLFSIALQYDDWRSKIVIAAAFSNSRCMGSNSAPQPSLPCLAVSSRPLQAAASPALRPCVLTGL